MCEGENLVAVLENDIEVAEALAENVSSNAAREVASNMAVFFISSGGFPGVFQYSLVRPLVYVDPWSPVTEG